MANDEGWKDAETGASISDEAAGGPPSMEPLALDGEVLNGRLMIHADSLGVALWKLAKSLDAVDPLVLIYAGQTPGAVVGSLAYQLLTAAQQYGTRDRAESAAEAVSSDAEPTR